MIKFDDLITPVTQDQFVERFLANLELMGLKARSWRPGGVYRTIIVVLAAICAVFSDYQVQFVRSAFLDLAQGNWLTWVALYVYGVERPEATRATGQGTLSELSGVGFTFQPGELVVFNPTSKKSYTNALLVELVPFAVLTIDLIAVEIGAASSSAAAAINTVSTQYTGLLSITNPAPVVGADAMEDPELKQLCLDKLAASSVFGVRGAYRYAIRTAKRPDGSTVDINRVSISPSSSTGVVTMFVASPSGSPTSGDLDAVRTNVEETARPDTDTATTNGATPVTITRSLTIWAEKRPGLIAADLTALAQTQLVNLQRTYPIGGIRKATSQGYFYADKLEGSVQKAHDAIFDVEGIGADVALSAGQVAVLAITIAAVNIIDSEVH